MPFILVQRELHPRLLVVEQFGMQQLRLGLEGNLVAHVAGVELGDDVALLAYVGARVVGVGSVLIVPFVRPAVPLEVVADERRGSIAQGREARLHAVNLFVAIVVEHGRWGGLIAHHQDVGAVERCIATPLLSVGSRDVVHLWRAVGVGSGFIDGAVVLHMTIPQVGVLQRGAVGGL